jgi:Putative glycolipid-binding
MMPTRQGAYAWRRLDLQGTTVVAVAERPDGIVVRSVETCAEDGRVWAAMATSLLDGDWGHIRTDVTVVDAHGSRDLVVDDLAGCDVLDLAGNPFTNAFVLRRPDIADDVEVLALYVETPSLGVRRLRQRYRRLDAGRWEYADETGAFAMGVDADGVVVDYEGLATRL